MPNLFKNSQLSNTITIEEAQGHGQTRDIGTT